MFFSGRNKLLYFLCVTSLLWYLFAFWLRMFVYFWPLNQTKKRLTFLLVCHRVYMWVLFTLHDKNMLVTLCSVWKLPEGLEALRLVWLWHLRSFPRETLLTWDFRLSFRKLVCEWRKLTSKHFWGSKPSGGFNLSNRKKKHFWRHIFFILSATFRGWNTRLCIQNVLEAKTLRMNLQVWCLLDQSDFFSAILPEEFFFFFFRAGGGFQPWLLLSFFFSSPSSSPPLLLSFPFLRSSRDA